MRIKLYIFRAMAAVMGLVVWPALPVMINLAACSTISAASGVGVSGVESAIKGVPFYPGSKLFGTQRGRDRIIYISMVTEDSPAKVAEFYSRRLEAMGGWSSMALMDGLHFWRGGKEPDPYGVYGRPAPDVRISPILAPTGLAGGHRTLIAIQNRGAGEGR